MPQGLDTRMHGAVVRRPVRYRRRIAALIAAAGFGAAVAFFVVPDHQRIRLIAPAPRAAGTVVSTATVAPVHHAAPAHHRRVAPPVATPGPIILRHALHAPPAPKVKHRTVAPTHPVKPVKAAKAVKAHSVASAAPKVVAHKAPAPPPPAAPARPKPAATSIALDSSG